MRLSLSDLPPPLGGSSRLKQISKRLLIRIRVATCPKVKQRFRRRFDTKLCQLIASKVIIEFFASGNQ
jgi:hypothetical protein